MFSFTRPVYRLKLCRKWHHCRNGNGILGMEYFQLIKTRSILILLPVILMFHLRVTNSFGCVTSVTNPQYIQISSWRESRIYEYRLLQAVIKPATIQFSNTSTGIGALSYQWQFGDGSTSTLENPSHTYSMIGSYTVSLIVFNTNGCSDTIIKPNVITLGNVKADFSVPADCMPGNQCKFFKHKQPCSFICNVEFWRWHIFQFNKPCKGFCNCREF